MRFYLEPKGWPVDAKSCNFPGLYARVRKGKMLLYLRTNGIDEPKAFYDQYGKMTMPTGMLQPLELRCEK